MRKTILVFCSLALLVSGCNKVQTVEEPEKDSSRHLTVDIDVNFTSESRSVKTGWEAGDVIYVAFDEFFTDDPTVSTSETVYYMTLTYNGSSWISAFSDEALEQYLLERESGLLAAVYYSDLSSPYHPFFKSYKNSSPSLFLIGDYDIIIPGFYMYAKKAYLTDPAVYYTVSDGKLTASLNMVLPDYEIQFFIDGINPEDSDRFSFKCSWVSYDQCYGFDILNGVRTMADSPVTPSIPVAPRADGVIACGMLYYDSVDKEKEYVVELTDNSGTPEDESDDIVYTLTKTATIHCHDAIKLPSLSDPRWEKNSVDPTHGTLNGYAWVRMADGRKWATMNVLAQTEEDAGFPFSYSNTDACVNTWGEGWRLPTSQEWESLLTNASHQITWEKGDDDSFCGMRITVMDGNNTPGNTLTRPTRSYYSADTGTWENNNSGHYWARDNNVAKRLIFIPLIEDAYIDNTGGNLEDRIPVRLIVDEKLESTGVGVDFNGFNDMVQW